LIEAKMGGSWMMMGGNDKDEDSKFKAFDFFSSFY
jgi:hypothetical protein